MAQTTKTKFSLLFAVILISYNACKKEDSAPGDNCVIEKSYYYPADTTRSRPSYNIYYRNSEGKLTSSEHYDTNNTYLGKTIYGYNDLGHLLPNKNVGGRFYYDSLTYKGSRIVKWTLVNTKNGKIELQNTFEYNFRNQLDKIILLDPDSFKIQGMIYLTYSGGNVTRVDEANKEGVKTGGHITYTYSDLKNPYFKDKEHNGPYGTRRYFEGQFYSLSYNFAIESVVNDNGYTIQHQVLESKNSYPTIVREQSSVNRNGIFKPSYTFNYIFNCD